ncbi:hypothetical protein TNCV_4784501 [Trichonephila clavipes]|nr:hypothetical protein TNCV_4784501 [Trichonephila clavipes]
MMDLRSSRRVLRPQQFQAIKEVIKSSHLLLARSQKSKGPIEYPSELHRLQKNLRLKYLVLFSDGSLWISLSGRLAKVGL